jgi:hypothetical protein
MKIVKSNKLCVDTRHTGVTSRIAQNIWSFAFTFSCLTTTPKTAVHLSYMHYIYMFICVFVFIPDYHVMSGIVFVFYVLSVSIINVRNGSRRVFVVDIICDCCRARVVSCYIDTGCHYLNRNCIPFRPY